MKLVSLNSQFKNTQMVLMKICKMWQTYCLILPFDFLGWHSFPIKAFPALWNLREKFRIFPKPLEPNNFMQILLVKILFAFIYLYAYMITSFIFIRYIQNLCKRVKFWIVTIKKYSFYERSNQSIDQGYYHQISYSHHRVILFFMKSNRRIK